jgi:peroxiredoxin
MRLKIGIFVTILVGTLVGCQRQEPTSDGESMITTPADKQGVSQPPKMSEEEFRKGMALDNVKEVKYLNEDGGNLTFAEFIKTVTAGRSFKKEVEADRSLAVMTISSIRESLGSVHSRPLNFPVSAELPPIKNKDLGGHLHALSNGKNYTLLSFFFADCVPCIQEIPALNSLSSGHSSLNVVSVTFENKEVASKFATQRGLNVPIIPDSKDYIEALGVTVYPTLVLVSPEGRLMGVRSSYKVSGSQDSALAELQSWLNSLGLKT